MFIIMKYVSICLYLNGLKGVYIIKLKKNVIVSEDCKKGKWLKIGKCYRFLRWI